MNFNEIVPILERCKEGDQKAFDELYTSIWDKVYYMALLYTKNPTDATDITQDILIVVSKEIHKLNSIYAFSSWLNRITYNRCVNFIKKRNKSETVSLGDVEDQLVENRKEFLPADVLSNKESKEQIMKIIDTLPAEQKEALILYYFAQMSTEEIAISMGISQNAVHHKLSRARAKIREKVDLLQYPF